MTPRRYIVLAIITLTSALGDTFLAHGMKQLGPVSLHHLSTLLLALKIPWVLVCIVLLIGFFASYLAALSWADVTFVLPASSLAYVVVALLSLASGCMSRSHPPAGLASSASWPASVSSPVARPTPSIPRLRQPHCRSPRPPCPSRNLMRKRRSQMERRR